MVYRNNQHVTSRIEQFRTLQSNTFQVMGLPQSNFSLKYIYIYRISANSFRGNYSFLNLTLCTVTFGYSTVTFGQVHTGAEIIRGNTVCFV